MTEKKHLIRIIQHLTELYLLTEEEHDNLFWLLFIDRGWEHRITIDHLNRLYEMINSPETIRMKSNYESIVERAHKIEKKLIDELMRIGKKYDFKEND